MRLTSLFSRKPREHYRLSEGRGGSCRPRLEALEDRALLSLIPVTSLADSGAGSLRQAILDANSLPSNDTIAIQVTGIINLASVLPDLSTHLAIEGPGPDLMTVRRDTGYYRIFTVPSGATVSLSGLTIANGYSDSGGGIDNAGTLTLTNCTLSENSVYGYYASGGAIYNRGTLTLSDCILSENSADGGDYSTRGGAIFNVGTLTVSGCFLSGNFTTGSGEGGLYGAAIYNGGALTVSHSVFYANRYAGQALYSATGTLTVSHTTFAGNAAGGIFSSGTSTVSYSTLSGNSGTGLYNGGGTLTVSHSTLSGNSRDGIWNWNGTLTVSHSTLSGNLGQDGIIFNRGGMATISNSTISGNGTTGITNHALYSFHSTVQLVNTTVAGNGNWQIYTGRLNSGTAQAIVRFRNTIVSGGRPYPNFVAGPNGTFVSEGHNLSSDGSGNLNPDLGDLPSTDPLLGPLANNGGPTFTHALLPGSPALDAGDPNFRGPPKNDQRGRGHPRVVAGRIDIGAFEVQSGAATSLVAIAPAVVRAGVPFEVTVVALDAYGHVATGYTGTVRFTTSDRDPGVLLPADYTFTADDLGVHTFRGLTLYTPGEQTLLIADLAGGLSASLTLRVDP